MCICLWPEFDCPEVTQCGWQDIKIQLLTNDVSICLGDCWRFFNELSVYFNPFTAGPSQEWSQKELANQKH